MSTYVKISGEALHCPRCDNDYLCHRRIVDYQDPGDRSGDGILIEFECELCEWDGRPPLRLAIYQSKEGRTLFKWKEPGDAVTIFERKRKRKTIAGDKAFEIRNTSF